MKKLCIILLLASFFWGCVPGLKDALQFKPETLANRQMQTRRFSTTNYQAMLNAASGVFQDLGFTLDESEYKLGILVGSKSRDATSAGQIAGAIFLGLLTGQQTHVDKDQYIRASMVMREIKAGSSTVRVTFQRIIRNTAGQITLQEQINESAVYQEFFDKLSQAVFLEAHEL
jgi:hypothetical protein